MSPRRCAAVLGLMLLACAPCVAAAAPAVIPVGAAGATPSGIHDAHAPVPEPTPSPPPAPSTLRLASQTSWVSPTANVFELKLIAHTPPPGDADLAVDVFNIVETRSDFGRSLASDFSGAIIAHPIRARLDSFLPDVTGAIALKIPVGRATGELRLPASGVYPVAVELRAPGGGAPLARFVTHLLYTASPPTTPKLNVAWVLPVHVPPGDPRRSPGTVTPAQAAPLGVLAGALGAHPGIPVTLAPTPDTIASLEVADPATVSRLGRSLAGREVLASPWVPVSLPAMLSAGLGDQLSLSLTRGTDALSAGLGTTVAGRTWVEDGPIDAESLSFLRAGQFDRVVLPEADLDPNPFRFTMSQPFEVAGSNRTPVRAAVADAGLGSHFVDQPDPVLAAHQLLADLAQLYRDAPANTRGVVIVTPRSWVPDAALLDAVLSGLAASPILATEQVDAFFDTTPPALGRDGSVLIRHVVTDAGAVRAAASGLAVDAQRAARAQLEAIATTVPATSSVYPRLERLLLQVPSADLSAPERVARLDAFTAAVRTELGLVMLPKSRTVTLTARRGQLPVTVTSGSDELLNVLLEVQSDKLAFPGAAATGPAVFPLTLHKGNNLMALTVEARTSGAFPLRITVLSHDHGLVISRTSFTVQSTVLSGVGVVLTVGAAMFLVVWWGRHAWRARRTAGAGPRRHHSDRRDRRARRVATLPADLLRTTGPARVGPARP